MNKVKEIIGISLAACLLVVTPVMAASENNGPADNKMATVFEAETMQAVQNSAEYVKNTRTYDKKMMADCIRTTTKIGTLKGSFESEMNDVKKLQEELAKNKATVIVDTAYSYLGVPYSWGGTSKSGIDCSGLTMRAHQAAGISLSHASGVQGAGGERVDGMSNALPGDLVCYSGHVGIYIGNGKMIHAPKPGRNVEIMKVYGNPWFKRYW